MEKNDGGSVAKNRSALQGRQSKQRYRKRKKAIYDILGNQCNICGIRDERVLQIDHRYSDGNKERGLTRAQLYNKVEKQTRRYQLLCANCNWRKRSKDFTVQARSNVWWTSKRSLAVATIISLFIIGLGVYHAT